jgi:hypothetical protein
MSVHRCLLGFVPISALSLAVVACGASTVRTGPDPVPFSEWCSIVCEATSDRIADTCGARIMDASVCAETCTQGRGETKSGRTYDEANACVSYIDSLACEEIGAAAGAAALGQGEYAQRCTAR